MSSFMQLVISGRALTQEIDDYVDQWHNSDTNVSLDKFLGMKPEEYVLWVESSSNLPYIVAARRQGVSVAEFNTQHTEFKLAARAEKSEKVRAIAKWLASRNDRPT